MGKEIREGKRWKVEAMRENGAEGGVVARPAKGG